LLWLTHRTVSIISPYQELFMATANTAAIQKLYVAYFNRPADPAGLAYWEKVVAAAGGSTTAVSAAFSKEAEYTTVFAGMSPTEIIAQVYVNLFGHPADAPGLLYWVAAYNAGTVTISNVVTSLAAGAQGTDAVAVAQKVIAATAFTVALNTTEAIVAYEKYACLAVGKAYLSSVTDVATATAAVANVAVTVQATIDAGDPLSAASTKAGFAATAAATMATTKIAAATAAATAVSAADAAATAAQTAADATDAAALTAAATAAADAKTAADANVTTTAAAVVAAQAAYAAALASNDPVAVRPRTAAC
jgi:hypothetical protein